ncbi:MAG: transcriptional repressor [Polyangiaceae bacterium]
MKRESLQALTEHGIQPSAQRVAVADFVLYTTAHPSADQVWAEVKRTFPMLSRATVYNTLNLFTEKGLLRELVLAEGKVVFDPKLDPHHHFLDEETGEIVDVPWSALDVRRVHSLSGFDVREYQVVMRGKKTRAQKRS